jgi:ABC-type antimicrobial peptide transport system permease subunit
MVGLIAGFGERFREIGIRVALGAQASDVTGMILRQGLRLAAFGITAGFLGAGVQNGTVDLTAALSATFNNPDNDAANRITLAASPISSSSGNFPAPGELYV